MSGHIIWSSLLKVLQKRTSWNTGFLLKVEKLQMTFSLNKSCIYLSYISLIYILVLLLFAESRKKTFVIWLKTKTKNQNYVPLHETPTASNGASWSTCFRLHVYSMIKRERNNWEKNYWVSFSNFFFENIIFFWHPPSKVDLLFTSYKFTVGTVREKKMEELTRKQKAPLVSKYLQTCHV